MAKRPGMIYVAARLVEKPSVEVEINTPLVLGAGSTPVPLGLPKGCCGILYAFETMKAAREYYGKDVGLLWVRKDTGGGPEDVNG